MHVEDQTVVRLQARILRLKRRERVVIALSALPTLALVGLVLIGATPQQKPVGAKPRLDTVIAKKFILVDDDEATRATLNVDNPGSPLSAFRPSISPP